jgi:hypothetical protein
VKENFTGSYTAYRHSLLRPGFVLIGHLNIYYDDKTGAVKTEENYRVIDSPITPAVEFRLEGYILRRNAKFRIVSKHIGMDELQYMYLGNVLRRGGLAKSRQALTISGVVCDIQADAFYCTRIVFDRDRLDDQNCLMFSNNVYDEANLKTVTINELPDKIQAHLNQKLDLTEDKSIVIFSSDR